MLNIKANDALLETYNNMKLKHKIGYIVASVQKDKETKQEFIGLEGDVYQKQGDEDYREKFIEQIKAAGTVRFGVIDYNNKLLFVHWSPDSGKAKDKMVYSSIKEAFIQSLVGINQKVQATDDGELNADVIAELTKSDSDIDRADDNGHSQPATAKHRMPETSALNVMEVDERVECWFREFMEKEPVDDITQIIRAYYQKEFVYESDYDGNGVVYWVGTKYGTEKEWKNPSKRGLIRVDSVGWYGGSVEDMVAKEACDSCSLNRVYAWASVEFVDGLTMRPTKYTLSQCLDEDDYTCLRSWVFEGSNDGEEWTVIREHSWDTSFRRAGQSHSWDTPNADEYFSRFRVRMTGEDSDGEWILSAHALEIYGFVRG